MYFQTTGFGRTRVLGVIVDLGIADELGDLSLTAEELAARLGLHADALHRLLRAAATGDIVNLDDEGRFSLTRTGRVLRADHPFSMRDFVRYLNLRSTQEAWAADAVAETLRTGEPTFAHGARAVGLGSLRRASRGEARVRRVDAARDRARPAGHRPRLPVARARHCVRRGRRDRDRSLAARPGLHGVLVEAPGVLEEADSHLAGAGVRDRVTLVAGDMFAGIEATADV